jgi:hypothetical protein
MPKIRFRAALAGCFFGLTPSSVWAQAGLDQCNDILKQDLFNKVHSSSQATSSERAAYAEYVYSLDETQAYDEYLHAYESSKKEGDSGKLAGGYGWGFIDGDAEFSHSYDRKLSQSEFSKKFNTSKAQHQKNRTSSSAKDASLISVYTSSVRDATSVKAWEHCMATKHPDPGLFAYGYRDGSGNPYIIVMWEPGTFAAANPVIGVSFSVTEPGMTIERGAGQIDIASGSGAAFPVRFSDSNDRKAQVDGFAVLVNGELKSGGHLVQSFRSEAVVPRAIGPISCSVIFAPNRAFDIGVLDSKTEQMNWATGLGFMMLARTEERRSKLPGPFIPAAPGELGPSGRPTRGHAGPSPINKYNARLFAPAGRGVPAAPDSDLVQLNISGSEFTMSDPDSSTSPLTGSCTGQGVVDAHMHTQYGQIPVSIRPQLN